ncbi:hypothetical protein [Actinoplanes sp. URMC 104]|uniref:hypothetical protein n=1 Tax=Actinoplanes sp. URMC 104 TaxID=3423409 RepID=UPI003F1BEA35
MTEIRTQRFVVEVSASLMPPMTEQELYDVVARLAYQKEEKRGMGGPGGARHRDDRGRRRLRGGVVLVTAPRAADLPLKTHIRAGMLGDLWKHPKSPPEFPWFCSTGGFGEELSDEAVQLMLDDGSAQVLRVGAGSRQ